MLGHTQWDACHQTPRSYACECSRIHINASVDVNLVGLGRLCSITYYATERCSLKLPIMLPYSAPIMLISSCQCCASNSFLTIYLGLSICHKRQTHFGALRQTRMDGLVVSSLCLLAFHVPCCYWHSSSHSRQIRCPSPRCVLENKSQSYYTCFVWLYPYPVNIHPIMLPLCLMLPAANNYAQNYASIIYAGLDLGLNQLSCPFVSLHTAIQLK